MNTTPRPPARPSGSALIIVLIGVALVVLIAVLALSIATSDRRVASNILARESAQVLAEVALDDVANKLATIPLDRHWAAAPGRLRIWNGSGWDQVDLHSGDGSGNTNPNESVDLNARLTDGTYPILPPNKEFTTAPEMRVRWIYVMGDGSTSPTPPATGVVGRYAYWADIENGRVNLNTAGLGMTRFSMPDLQSWVKDLAASDNAGNPLPGSLPTLNQSQFLTEYRNNVWARNPWVSDRVEIDPVTGLPTFPPLSLSTALENTPQYLTAHPSSINLSYLDGVSPEVGFNTFRYAGSYFLRADALTSMLQGGEVVTGTEPFYWDAGLAQNVDLSVRLFDAPEDWKRIVDPDTFEANKGYITVRGRTPEITPWGTQKLALSFPAREHANQRNDLTETDLRRNVRLHTNVPTTTSPGYPGSADIYENIQDTRVVQMPALNPGHEDFSTASPGRFHRLMIRDITAGSYASPLYNQSRPTPNRLSVLWSIKQHLAGALPGLPGSLAGKYNASSVGEADQVTVELATFLDNQLSSQYPGRTRNLILLNQPSFQTGINVNQMHYSGRRLPYVPTNSGDPPIRRLGSHGGPLLNEVRAKAFSVPVTRSGATMGTFYIDKNNNNKFATVATLTALGNGTLSISSPVARISSAPTNTNVSAMFLLRNPTWILPPPSGTTDDRFIRIEFDTEAFLPLLWSLRTRTPGYDPVPKDSRYSVFLNDVVVELDGQSLRANYLSDSDGSKNDGRFAILGTLIDPMVPGNPPIRLRRDATLPAGIFIGPFAPTDVVSFKIKVRVVLNHVDATFNNATGTVQPTNNSAAYASVVPGIFPDPTVPPTGTSGEEVETFLEFSFPAFDLSGLLEKSSGTTVSLEARDPRVTRRKVDWTIATPDSLGAQNSVYNPGATADLYRPDPLLQHVRGMLRSRISGNNTDEHLETQTASRILGLPGVGYLSSIPTGVNSGIPWQTMKFTDNAETVPDWMLWSLFYVPFDRSIHNQTDGKLNINSTLWPWGIKRARPLEALLGDRVSNPESLSTAIASAAGSGKSIGPDDMFVYPGQICQVSGVASSGGDETAKEALARDLADIITTQCDDYRVFVVSQSLRQAPNGTLTPVSTARMEATISRSPDEGGGDFFFGPQGGGDLAVFTRAAYQSGGTRGTRINAKTGSSSDPFPTYTYGFSTLGLDGLPNTADDWLIPQKVEISALRFLP